MEKSCHSCHTVPARSIWTVMFLAIPLLILALLPLFGYSRVASPELAIVEFLLSFVILFYGRSIIKNGFQSITNGKAGMDTLVTLGTGVAFLFSTYVLVNWLFTGFFGEVFFDAAGLVMAFVLFGRFLEHRAESKTKRALSALLKVRPVAARLMVKNKEQKITVEEVKPGNTLRVKPGDVIPVDGVIIVGATRIDESMLTGESSPVKKTIHGEVFAGTINKTGMFMMKATGVGKDTAFNRILKIVEDAQASRAPVQRVADSVASVFVPIVLLVSIITFIYWFVVAGIGFALSASIAVLVISCPCALGLATPIAVVSGIGSAGRRGILFKDARSLQKAATVKMVAIDKTGTLTIGKPEVIFVKAYDVSEKIVFRYAASMETGSEHPLGEAIRNYAKLHKINFGEPRTFENVEGFGVKGKVEGRAVVVGSLDFFLREKIGLYDVRERLPELAARKLTPVLVAVDGKLAGIIGISDPIKKEASEAISDLNKIGVSSVMLTGDSDETASAVAKQIGIRVFRSRLKPEQKLNEIAKLQRKRPVAMVGDGINDAPALAKADIGIAVGSGTGVALESADVILVRDDLTDVPLALSFASKTMRVIKQNLFWALGYNVVAIPIAVGVLYPSFGFLMNPALAGALMAASSLSVVLNSLRLR